MVNLKTLKPYNLRSQSTCETSVIIKLGELKTYCWLIVFYDYIFNLNICLVMTLKASPLSNPRFERSEYPGVSAILLMHPEWVPQHLVLLKGHTLRGASLCEFPSGGTRYRSHASEWGHLRRLTMRNNRLPIQNTTQKQFHIFLQFWIPYPLGRLYVGRYSIGFYFRTAVECYL